MEHITSYELAQLLPTLWAAWKSEYSGYNIQNGKIYSKEFNSLPQPLQGYFKQM